MWLSGGGTTGTAAWQCGVARVEAMPCRRAGKRRNQQERQGGQARQQRQNAGRGGGDHQRVRAGSQLRGQLAMHLAFDGALGHDDTGRGGDQQRGDLRHQPVADRQGRVGRERTFDGHVRPEQAHRQTAENVDQRDDQGADGVAADELAGAVHRAVEAAFLGQFGAAFAGGGFIDGAGRKVRVDRHLLAWHRSRGRSARRLPRCGWILW